MTGVASSHADLRAEAPTRAVNDRAMLRRASGIVGIGLAAFALAAWLIGRAVDSAGWRPAIPEPFATKLAACLAAQPDTVFVGSSRYYHQIDPARIAAGMAAHGVPGVHAFALGFDALSFPEALGVADALLADPRCRVRRLVFEPSLRPRFAPGLARSQRLVVWHDPARLALIYGLIAHGDFGAAKRAYWAVEHAEPATLRLLNVGTLSGRFIAAPEAPVDAAELLGPAGDGYAPLIRPAEAPQRVGPADVARIAHAGAARALGAYELGLVDELRQRCAAAGARLILVAPPTAHPDVHDEFAAVAEAARAGRIAAPTHVFADPGAYPELYRPAGFRDLDHVWSDVAAVFTDEVAAALAADEPAARTDAAGGAR